MNNSFTKLSIQIFLFYLDIYALEYTSIVEINMIIKEREILQILYKYFMYPSHHEHSLTLIISRNYLPATKKDVFKYYYKYLGTF